MKPAFRSISIGIHIQNKAEWLSATLAALKTNTIREIEVALLVDEPDMETLKALEQFKEYVQLTSTLPRGAPAAFNTLLRQTEAGLYIFLENGVVVGRSWLDHLLAALDADPKNGLAGPSTNRSWNEQRQFPNSHGSLEAVNRTAETAARRFGSAWQPLTPLHSLGDFCYAVKKEVVEAIGGADETYGRGPCWEMDYNIRAARAGFQGVWAKAAYVYRPPFTEQRRRQEQKLFTANKHLYQGRFCALHLLNQSAAYKTHCRGDACEHFAPPDLIQVKLPLESEKGQAAQEPNLIKIEPQPIVEVIEKTLPKRVQTERVQHEPHQSEPVLAKDIEAPQPLVSCIMPTRDRPLYAMQAFRYFLNQDYPARELIIVDDSLEPWQSELPDDPRIKFIQVKRDLSIGAKRNLACDAAQGEIIIHWDDDDWYGPNRLGYQVAPLLDGSADISGLTGTIFFELDRWRFWSCTPSLHRRLFVESVHGGTIAYRKQVWQQKAKFPNRSLAEDAIFLRQAVKRGALLQRLPNNGLFLYLRHAENSWSFHCGRYLDRRGWGLIEEPPLPPVDRNFYLNLSKAVKQKPNPPIPTIHLSASTPLVSCIMPTADRRAFVPHAVSYFLEQDYLAKELIVVDDGADAIKDLIPDDKRIRYFRQETKQTVGAKRNFANKQANGTYILHWDDDDWMAPHRINYQVKSLLTAEADMCGLATIYYLQLDEERAWKYEYPKNGRAWVAGNTLCYKKSFWERNPFQPINVGEDTRFVWSRSPKNILQLDDPTILVAFIHKKNASPKQLSGHRWHQLPIVQLLNIVGKEIANVILANTQLTYSSQFGGSAKKREAGLNA